MSVKFKISENVVYPPHGVGTVDSTFDRELNGKMVPFYKVQLMDSGMTVSVPVESAEAMGLRKLIKKADIPVVLKKLQVYPDKIEENWKQRYQDNTEKIKQGDIDSILSVVKELYVRNKIKNLSIQERKQYESAFKMLMKEISLSGNTNEEEAKTLISVRLDSLAAHHEKVRAK